MADGVVAYSQYQELGNGEWRAHIYDCVDATCSNPELVATLPQGASYEWQMTENGEVVFSMHDGADSSWKIMLFSSGTERELFTAKEYPYNLHLFKHPKDEVYD